MKYPFYRYFVILLVISVVIISGCTSLKNKTFSPDNVSSSDCPPKFLPIHDKISPHPDIKEVAETWVYDSESLDTETLKEEGVHRGFEAAQDILKMGNVYKMFTGMHIRDLRSQVRRETGIAVFISDDLNSWEYKGMVVKSDPGYVFSHPWVLELENGYRMFYQVNKDMGEETGVILKPPFSIWSAYSPDGENWKKEGLVIGGNESRFVNAAHGRAQRLDKYDYIMVFSGKLRNSGPCEPGHVWIARSTDGENWNIQEEPLAYYSHDPTIVYENGILKVYYSYLGEEGGMFFVESRDKGKTFSEPKYAVFLNEYGYDIFKNPPKGKVPVGNPDYDGVKYMWQGNEPGKERMMFTRFVRSKE